MTQFLRRRTFSVVLGMALVGLLAFSVAAVRFQSVKLQGSGASFPNPVYQRWVTEYGKKFPNARIDYQSVGSGGGIRAIKDKTVAFAGSDAPLGRKDREEMAKGGSEAVHIPTVAGAVVMAYNLPGFEGDLRLSGEVIADMYAGKITKWDDARLKALNPDAKLPSLPINPVYRTDGSGTNFIFTNYLATQSEWFSENIGVGTSVQWKTGLGGRGSEGVTAFLTSTPGAVGYIEHLYATSNNIHYALIRNTEGKFIKATSETVAAAGEGAAKAMTDKSLAVPLWNQPGENAYPIAAFTYIIVYRDLGYLGSKERAQTLFDFLTWATTDGQPVAAEMGYAPLSPAVREKVQALLSTLKFEGQPLAKP